MQENGQLYAVHARLPGLVGSRRSFPLLPSSCWLHNPDATPIPGIAAPIFSVRDDTMLLH